MLGSRSQCGKLLKGKFAINLKEPKISTKESLKNVTAKKTIGLPEQEERARHLHNYKENIKYHQPTTLLQSSKGVSQEISKIYNH